MPVKKFLTTYHTVTSLRNEKAQFEIALRRYLNSYFLMF